MIKKLFLSLSLVFLLGSCTVAVDDAFPSTDVVVRYGIPYYYDGNLTYYRYNGWYYYPYRINDVMYYHRYQRPVPPRAGRPIYTPDRPYRRR